MPTTDPHTPRFPLIQLIIGVAMVTVGGLGIMNGSTINWILLVFGVIILIGVAGYRTEFGRMLGWFERDERQLTIELRSCQIGFFVALGLSLALLVIAPDGMEASSTAGLIAAVTGAAYYASLFVGTKAR